MVNYIVLGLHELLKDDPKQFREYLSMIDILAENRNLQPHIEKASQMITQITVEKSGLYQLGKKRGEKGGEQRGERRGIISTLQKSIINILTTRFQQIPELINTQLLATKNINTLNKLLITAININKPENLFDE